ncbi:MAG: hydrogenase formation protein HypD [Planctomycetota bacterium]
MKYVDDFRDSASSQAAAAAIERIVRAAPDRTYRIMEVCGGHTHAIFRFGLTDLLPDCIEFVHGPGCPVCVLPTSRVEAGLAVAERHDAIFTAFGDVLRVPGTNGTPLQRKAQGLDVRMVYSPLDALRIAEQNADREVVFFAIGFETTAPSTALTVRLARERGITNFSVLCNHVTIVPAMRAVVDSPGLRVDGFLAPGHVATVIGCRPFEFLAERYGKPTVVSGFEPVDMLQSVLLVLRQLVAGTARVENQYERVVPWEGNPAAFAVLAEVFELRPFFEWRGLGFLSQSALALRESFAGWDTERKFSVPHIEATDPQAAQCGEVLKGVLQPAQCKLFGRECTPETPVGALMVSSEGACAAHYQHRHR